ncbi:TraB/GumN family protein [Brevundimonas sp. 2R-24]|uniref:TraB/GumN family protein n=1 Tax=Peiella sedimenti TaxID=3061083 RepID=A0ABT8SKN8_9CAUL|nr:TraB/GumN family protein [Caulobacteraceae bacterium XZ-24]
MSLSFQSLTARLMRGAAGVALGLGLTIAALPQQALAYEAAAETPAAGSGPALFIVRDHDSTIYLMGTVHLMRPGDDWARPEIRQAFDASSELWLEITNVDDQAAAAPLIQQYGLSPQTPLSSRLSAEENARLAQVAGELGLTPQALEPMRPWLAGLLLTNLSLQKVGFDPSQGIDMVVRGWAREADKPVRGLEQMEDQIRLFAEMPEEAQLGFLRQSMDNAEEGVALLDRMADAWRRGDHETLDSAALAEMRRDEPAFYAAMFTARNANWVNQIQEMLSGSGTSFIAVGAGHLAGPDSVQAMLEQRGVTVERR